jgi:hypothetical protein
LATGTEAQLFAYWRGRQTGPRWFELLPLWRRGLAMACGVSLMLAVISLMQIESSKPDAWTMATQLASTTYVP